MAVDMFLKIDDLKGESRDEKHVGEIDVLSWNWGLSQSGSMHVSTGGGSGKVSVQDMTLTKKVDKSSPVLFKYCCDGKHFKEGTMTVRKAGGGSPVEYLKVNMKEIIISNISTGGSGGDDTVMETVSLNFAEVHVVYTPQKPDGSPDAEVKQGWNIAKNTSAG